MSAANEVVFLLEVDDTLCIVNLAHFDFSTRGAFRVMTQ
jgi:hypothetical protein